MGNNAVAKAHDSHAFDREIGRAAVDALREIPGLRVELAADMQGSPLDRARIYAGNCDQIVRDLADGEPSIRVWQHGLPLGYFELDPRTVDDSEMQAIGERLHPAESFPEQRHGLGDTR